MEDEIAVSLTDGRKLERTLMEICVAASWLHADRVSSLHLTSPLLFRRWF